MDEGIFLFAGSTQKVTDTGIVERKIVKKNKIDRKINFSDCIEGTDIIKFAQDYLEASYKTPAELTIPYKKTKRRQKRTRSSRNLKLLKRN